MSMLPGYEIHEQVHRGARSTLTRATQVASGTAVMLKTSAVDYASSSALARSQHELSVASPIRSKHVVSYLGVERFGDRVALVQEAFGDCSLAELLQREHLTVEAALVIGVQIASGLAEIHAHGVTHRAIHPGNVMIDTPHSTVKIIDFADASVLHESAASLRLDASAIPLQYISPEQTGRMNRKVDYRTDLYSLGATLYHALAGRPPFAVIDPLSLVHAHIALPQHSLHEVDSKIPLQLARVIAKLLAKNAEDRYQNARGVVADLEACLGALRDHGEIETFALGRHDLPEKFLIPQKLYGRGEERAELLEAFDAAAHGQKVLLLVTGYSGIGKSSLVHEVQPSIVERRGHFAAGKLDTLKRGAPYSALAQALGRLCRSLLSLPDTELAAWKQRILDEVAGNARLIIDIVPELELIVGVQPMVLETGLVESQHRFDLTVTRFLAAFARREHPLVLFLDDLQWADPSTLHTLSAILRMPEPTHLLVIGAYRDNEVDALHPLSVALDALRRTATPVRSVQLTGLSSDDLKLLVADTLHRSPAETAELAALVLEKTSGNPFFVAEFLRMLHEEKVLRLSDDHRAWIWELRDVEALGITDNVAPLMLRKLERLPAATYAALRMAACIGNVFDLELLSAATEVSTARMRARLAPAIRERLLTPLDPNYPLGLVDVANDTEPEPTNHRYRFLHDRVQQAAYESVPEIVRGPQHRRLGRLLHRRMQAAGRHEMIFDSVDQWNRGIAWIHDREERLELAQLNLEAGRRARASTAYHEAREYLARGLSLLPDDAWITQYTLALALHLQYAQCAYLCGLFDEASAFSDSLLPKIRTVLDKAELYSARIVLETNRGQFGRALSLAREALSMLGHPAPTSDSVLPLLAVRGKAMLAMRGRRIDDLAQLPKLNDRHIAAVVKILSHVYAPAYFGDQKSMFFWAVHENLCLALKHGTTAATAAGYTNYGSFLIAAQGDYEGALAFGRLALSIAERDDAFALRSHVHHVVGATSHAYARNHLRTTIPLLQRAIELGLESGDLLYGSFASAVLPDTLFMVGEPIDDVVRETELRERSIRALHQDEMTLALRMFLQCMLCLRGETAGRTSLTTHDVDEAALVVEMDATPAQLARHFYSMYKVILLTLFGEREAAVRMILASDAAIESSMAALVRLTEYGFFAALALVEGLRSPVLDTSTVKALLDKKRAKLARWAKSAPMNFKHKHLLVNAELAELEGRTAEATTLYDAAIREATANGYHQHAALASELAGRTFARRGTPEIARAYREAARSGYARWGALGKVRALDEAHPELVPQPVGSVRMPLALDALSVVRASQALSSEISLPGLIERVMEVIAQTSGAQRVSLLLQHEGELRIEARLDVQTNSLARVSSVLTAGDLVSEAIVRYTLRTGDDIVLGNAASVGEFTRDPYVVAHASKSILSMAVRHRDRVTGVIFLENELSTDVFTEARLEVLRLLVAQAAISLENARLYAATQSLNIELAAKISAQREAEAARARLEEQLRQSERLEAIGRLAAGVAHDFNNLLTPILMYSDAVVRSLPEDSVERSQVLLIMQAAEQSAELTRQLLAFGGREVLDTRSLNLNQELLRFEGMLRTMLRGDIEVELRLQPALGLVKADPSQVQRIAMNLVVNAADAMPHGGRLTIETENVELQASADAEGPSGACVVLRVRDTGHGMDTETLAKIFEPFFTTKPPGEGTGLGLPTVYGLVQQHGGRVVVRSEVGVGTTFEVIFARLSPRAH